MEFYTNVEKLFYMGTLKVEENFSQSRFKSKIRVFKTNYTQI